jgi:alpha-mannosidase
VRGARLHLALRATGLARVFLNGSMAAQGTGRLLLPILLTERAVPGERTLVAVSVAGRLVDARLSIDSPGQPDPGRLRRELESAEVLVAASAEGREGREKVLDEAVKAVDLAALDRGDQQAFTRSLESSQRALEPLRDWVRQLRIRAVGNSHIDMAWLWPWTETVEVVRDTFTTALQLMREYPDFTYAQSSAQAFAWMEEKYPDLFRQIQERVKEGRWELVGGMWVEPDLNMPDGESLVRQILVGKRYFRSRFGVDIHLGWNPDSFGYSWQLPQIYRKSGFDAFVTQKMSWNETTQFPHKLFWWESPDGSRLLTFFPHGYSNGIEPLRLAEDLATYAPATGLPEVMHLYGVGDHGGGPTRAMLDELVQLREPDALFPSIAFSTAGAFFDDVRRKLDEGLKLPVWKDELYLEYHRGCYTTQSETKKRIREGEELLQNAEKLASISYAAGRPYPHDALEEAWKKVLFDHFHDIMPGSGIGVNYLDAARNLHEAALASGAVLDTALADLAARADTRGVGEAVVVVNPLSWERSGALSVEVRAGAGPLIATDSAGRPLPTQLVSTDPVTGRVRLRVLARNIPPLGYEVLHVAAAGAGKPASALQASATHVENEQVRVEIDPKTGCITSLVRKPAGVETVAAGGCGNLLQAFADNPPRQDAWEIQFDKESWDLTQPSEVSLVEHGPVRAVVRVNNRFQSSSIVQDIILYAGLPRVEVETTVDWREKHILLKAGFPASVQSEVATYEIPYGTIARPTTRRTPAEQAKFEVPALRWGDLSDATHGLSLLNASKYGYDAVGNRIRLSLLRAPTSPDPHADEGVHTFTYAFSPHEGGWEQGRTMQQAYELNFPLLAVAEPPHAGRLPRRHSFAQVQPDNVILTVVKKAEDEEALVLRFYEFAGRQSQVSLRLPARATAAFETDLMEAGERPLTLSADGRSVQVPTGPYEIKTVKVRLARE